MTFQCFIFYRFQIFRLTGVDLKALNDGLTNNDFSKLSEFKKSIVQTESLIDMPDSSRDVDTVVTASKNFIDECNNKNTLIAFKGGRLGRLIIDRIVEISDVSDFDIDILAVPKVSSRRNVVFCIDRSGKLIVVCLHTFITISEWQKVS